MQLINKVKYSDFWKKLIKNVSILLFGSTTTSLLNLLTMLIIVRSVSTLEYSFFVLAQQYMSIMDALINFQSWQGVIKYGTDALVKKSYEKLYAVIKCGFLIDILSAVLGTLLAFVLVPFVGKMMGWSEDVILLCRLFSLEIVFHIEGTSIGILRLYDKFSYYSLVNTLASLIQLIAIGLYFVLGGRDLVVITGIYIVFDIVLKTGLVVVAIHVMRRNIGILKVVKAKFKHLEKGFIRYTMWSNVGRTADIPIGYFDVFIISMLSYELVAVYKIYKQIVQIISKVSIPISAAILPQFSMMIAEQKDKEAFDKVLVIRNYMLVAISFLTLLSLIAGKPIFNLILGVEYAEHISLFIIMLCLYGVAFSYVAIHPYFAAIGKVKEDFILNVVSNLMYCIVAFGLIKFLDVYAILIATAIQFGIVFSIKTILIKNYIRSKNNIIY